MPRHRLSATLWLGHEIGKAARPVRILYVSEIQWLSQVSRKQLIVRRLPDDWDVLFVSPMNTAAGENSMTTRIDPTHPNVRYASLPLPKPDSRLPLVRALTPLLEVTGTRRLVGVARSFRPDAVVCSYLWAAPALRAFKSMGAHVIYDLNDLHPTFYPLRRQEADAMFGRLIGEADEVVCSSSHLRDVAGRGVVIGNGVDLETFTGGAERPLPDVVADSPLSECQERVAYVGSLDERIDFDILEAVGLSLSGRPRRAGLMVVGRIFDQVAGRVRRLRDRLGDSVLFTGRLPYEELPGVLSNASVGIAPFVLSDRTRAINPNKLYMYAAMDMNIVSTPFSREIESLSESIYVARGPDEFARDVESALGDEDRRRAVRDSIAVPNGWDQKAGQFQRLLETIVRR